MKKYRISYLDRQLDLAVVEFDKWIDLNVTMDELIEAESEDEAIEIAMKSIRKEATKCIHLTVGDSYVLYLYGIHTSIDRPNKTVNVSTEDYGLVNICCNFSAEEVK